MTQDDLNGRFQNLYDRQEPDVPNRIWEKVDQELFPKRKRNGIVFWLSIFVGAIILTGTWFWNSYSKTEHTIAKNNSEKHSKQNNTKQLKSEDKSFSKNNKSEIKSKTTNNEEKNTSKIELNPLKENKSNIKTLELVESEPNHKISSENIPQDENLSLSNIDSVTRLPFLPITKINFYIKNLSIVPLQEITKSSDSKISMTAGIAFGKNIRYTNGIIDPELSVSKLRGDNRMALNLVQVKCGMIFNVNEKYAIGLGANYGFAGRKSPWYTRPTYFAQGQQGLVFQTLEGRYNITDATFLNSLVPNDTNDIKLKNSVSIKMFSIPLTVYRHFKRNNWTTSLNAGLSADIHFGKDFHFEVEQNNTTRQLLGTLENQTPVVSLQGLLGSRFSYLLSNSFDFYLEPQLSIPISSYLSTNNQNSYSASLTIGAGISYKF